MLPLVLHWFFIEWYSGKKSSSALFQHITALFECTMAAIITLLVSDPVGVLYIRSCRVLMLSDWYTMLYNPSPDYVTTVHCTHEAVYPLYTIVFVYYAFCLVLMMLLRPLLVKKIACGLGKSDRFKSIYAALYFFPILTVLQAVGGGLLYYAFPYIILVLSLVTLAVYMSASEIENCYDLLVRKKDLLFSSATGYCTPMELSPSPEWTGSNTTYRFWLWYRHQLCFTCSLQNLPNHHGYSQKGPMDTEYKMPKKPKTKKNPPKYS